MRFDPEGGLWVSGSQWVYYWNTENTNWVQMPLRTGAYLTRLYGNKDAGVYCTQYRDVRGTGQVYRLVNGSSEYVTDFLYDSPSHYAGFYVSKDGRFFNWAKGKLRVFEDRKWIEHDVSLPGRIQYLLDTGPYVCFLNKGRMVLVDDQNRIHQKDVEFADLSGKSFIKVLNDNTLLLAEKSCAEVRLVDLPSLNVREAEEINGILAGHPVLKVLTSNKDNLWLVVGGSKRCSNRLVKVLSDGTAEERPETAGFSWRSGSGYLVEDENGVLWLGEYGTGLIYADENGIHQLDPRTDGGPDGAARLVEDREGHLYAVGTHLNVKHQGSPLTQEPPPKRQRLKEIREPLWQHTSKKSVDTIALSDAVLYVDLREQSLVALELATGEVRFTYPINDRFQGLHARLYEGRPGQVILFLYPKIIVLDDKTGELVRRISLENIPHGDAIYAEGHVFTTESGRGRNLVHVRPDGSVAWKIALPGYVQKGTVHDDSLIVLQTRQGSYGGQAVAGVDAQAGELIWKYRTDAYGTGVIVTDDGRFSCETLLQLSPTSQACIVTCRETVTGEKRWEHQFSGAMSQWSPVFDRDEHFVYAAMNDGRVVCMDIQTGEIKWQQRLSQSPSDYAILSMAPLKGWFLTHECLAVLTTDGVINFLNKKTGKIRKRIPVAPDQYTGVVRKSPPSVRGPIFRNGYMVVLPKNKISVYRDY